eukprot:3741797-Amphidinium_carterae.2
MFCVFLLRSISAASLLATTPFDSNCASHACSVTIFYTAYRTPPKTQHGRDQQLTVLGDLWRERSTP